ncbi:MAG: HNH endonuclease [Pantoea sp.]|uniref:HNH endonuclease n=1 Tax=Pantoea sp. TaxID=69393 RepID=UPI00290E3486|nr:HNH endonuclease [Pantoea sp.]MDU5780714.1 HNH endonuclease [Pantoea sp.]
MSRTASLTQQRLKEVAHYDSATGIFTSRVRRGKIHPGDTLGTLCCYGYVIIKIDYVRYRAQRLAVLYMTGRWPEGVSDHINRDRSDNRWENIRVCNKAENNRNRSLAKNNTSGATGVVFDKRWGKWQVRIEAHGVRATFGYYKDFELAELVAREARHKYHGEFSS